MNKKILLFLLILISVCAISHVSAEEISGDVIAADDADIDKDVLSENPNEVLSNGTGDVSNDTSGDSKRNQ